MNATGDCMQGQYKTKVQYVFNDISAFIAQEIDELYI